MTKQIVERALSTESDFRRFLVEIERPKPGRPTLHVFHMLVPHPPWVYLPSGKRYPDPRDWNYGVGKHWSPNISEAIYGYQRHLLQVGFADRILGQLLRRLRKLDLYDDAVVVVAADHGASFLPGQSRRDPSEKNAAESLMVPLLIKLPGKAGGEVDEGFALTIDILPTIADAIGAELPWPVDGRSLLDRESPARDEVVVVRSKIADESFGTDSLLANFEAALSRKVRIFGQKPGNHGLYYIGQHRELIGKPLTEFQTLSASGPLGVRVYNLNRYLDVDLQSPQLPTLVEGSVSGLAARAKGIFLAIAVNHRIAAVVRTYRNAAGEPRFAAMVSENMLWQGRNRISVLEVVGSDAELRLKRFGRFDR